MFKEKQYKIKLQLTIVNVYKKGPWGDPLCHTNLVKTNTISITFTFLLPSCGNKSSRLLRYILL